MPRGRKKKVAATADEAKTTKTVIGAKETGSAQDRHFGCKVGDVVDMTNLLVTSIVAAENRMVLDLPEESVINGRTYRAFSSAQSGKIIVEML